MKNNIYLAVGLSVVVVIAVVLFLRKEFSDDIDISFAETEEAVTLSATFPDEDSKMVHDYVKKQLKMSDLTDFKYLEVKNYQTPDATMRFHVNAHAGYIKIVLEKKENSKAGYRKLKETAEGVKKLWK
jgi:acetone carboxylase gamma subunit